MIPALFEIALRGLMVAVLVGAGLRLLGVRDVLAQKWAWVLVLAAAVVMPVFLPIAARWPVLPSGMTLALPAQAWRAHATVAPLASSHAPASASSLESVPAVAFRRDTARSGESTSMAAMNAVSASVVSGGSLGSGVRSTIQTAPPPSAPTSVPERRSLMPTLKALALSLYFVVCGVLLLRLIYGLTSAVSVWLDAEPVDNAHAHNLPLRASRAVSSPVTIGSGVVLPIDYDEWDAEKLRIVLAHEQSHIRQGDFYLQLLAGLYTAVFWFNPLGWWIKRTLSDLGEAVSDRAALREAQSRSSYAQILLEFAGRPRPTLLGVAMARASSLSHRIERLLNDSSFRQAFSCRRGSALAAVLLVPVALIASTALVRVRAAAAQDATATQPASAPAPIRPAALPDLPALADTSLPQAPPAVAGVPVPPELPALADIGFPQAPPAVAGVPTPPEPPEPPSANDDDDVTIGAGQSLTITNSSNGHGRRYMQSGSGNGFAYSFDSDGDSYAVVSGNGDHISFGGDGWSGRYRDDIDKARRMAKGPFLWFTRDGKSYIVDDPSIVKGILAMYKPMEELGHQQEELGKQQEELGRQQEALGKKQEEASVPVPDVSREIAAIKEALASLEARKGGTVTQDDLGDLQSKIGDLQSRLGDIQGKIGDEQGRLGDEQGKLGEKQGELGEQQGRLGDEQGRLASEADRKVKSIIDESLHNGKARPVE